MSAEKKPAEIATLVFWNTVFAMFIAPLGLMIVFSNLHKIWDQVPAVGYWWSFGTCVGLFILRLVRPGKVA